MDNKRKDELGSLFVFNNKYEVIQIKGDRVVIGVNGQVTGAISKNCIEKI